MSSSASDAAGIVGGFFDRHRVGGAVVGLAAGGELAWVHTHGYEELEAGPPVGPETVFRIASITKTFSAAATMLLVGDGAMSLEDRAISWLPELGEAEGAAALITVEHLLTHRAGLPRESPSFDWARGRFPTAEEILAEADGVRLVGPPGGEPRYSNLGYQLVGEIVARAAGEPFEEVLRRRLLEPLGLRGAGFVPAGEAARRLARGYEARVFSDHLPPADERRKATSADGGLWATVGDVARWALVHLHGDERVLPKELVAELHRPRWDGEGPRPALGWYRTGDDADPRIGHSGGTFGFSGRLELAPAHELAAVVLAAGSAPVGELARTLLEHAARHGPPSGATASAPPRPAPLPAGYRDLLGLYAWEDLSLPVRVEWRDGGLAIARSWEDGGAAAALEPTDDPLAFVVRGGRAAGERLRFRRGSQGRIVGLSISGWPFVRLEPVEG